MSEEQTSQQALDWLIVLHERPYDREVRKRFDAWLASSRANEKAWADATKLWGLIGETPPAHAEAWASKTPPSMPVGPAVALRDRSVRRTGRRTRYWRGTLLLAGLAACLTLALPSISLYWQADHRTGVGETAQVTLRDGSIVHLGADSAVRVVDDSDVRRVDLLKGEAFFDVSPDPSRPFQVKAAQWTTTVLGTAFDVSLIPRAAIVAVEHGSVLVNDTGEGSSVEKRLEAGDWVRVEPERGVAAQGHGEPSQVAIWRQGRLVVKSRPIGEVIGELERYHRGVIVVTDANLKARLVSGVYDLHQPIEALKAVVQPHQAVVRELSPYLVIVSSL